jgi:hypothetical protein
MKERDITAVKISWIFVAERGRDDTTWQLIAAGYVRGGSERGVGGAGSTRFAANEISLFDLAGVIFGHTIDWRVSIMKGRAGQENLALLPALSVSMR